MTHAPCHSRAARAYGIPPPPPPAYRCHEASARGLMRGTAHMLARPFAHAGVSMEDAIAYLEDEERGASSQADGCLALAKLLRHNQLPGEARSNAVKLGAIELLVSALRSHPHDTVRVRV